MRGRTPARGRIHDDPCRMTISKKQKWIIRDFINFDPFGRWIPDA